MNNHYQNSDNQDKDKVNQKALEEFDVLAAKIAEKGVQVNIIQDTYDPSTPDSIFPNNWFSSHEEGILFFYPMFAENRREEVKKFRGKLYDIVRRENLKIVNYSLKAEENIFLEGTGSIVSNRKNKKAYCSLSSIRMKNYLKNSVQRQGANLLYFHLFKMIILYITQM